MPTIMAQQNIHPVKLRTDMSDTPTQTTTVSASRIRRMRRTYQLNPAFDYIGFSIGRATKVCCSHPPFNISTHVTPSRRWQLMSPKTATPMDRSRAPRGHRLPSAQSRIVSFRSPMSVLPPQTRIPPAPSSNTRPPSIRGHFSLPHCQIDLADPTHQPQFVSISLAAANGPSTAFTSAHFRLTSRSTTARPRQLHAQNCPVRRAFLIETERPF